MKKFKASTTAITGAVLLGFGGSVAAHEAGDIILRVGPVNVSPDESSTVVTTAATGPLGGTSVGVGNNSQLGLNLVYMATDNIGVEVLAATPFEHDLSVAGLDQYGFSTTDLGSTKHLPPTVSALYFFGSANSSIRPFIGAGLNYTTFFSKDLSNSAITELGASGLDLDDSWGLAGRAGVDFEISEKWHFNASVWTIDIDTDANFSSALGNVSASVDIDPWVYMISLGYKF